MDKFVHMQTLNFILRFYTVWVSPAKPPDDSDVWEDLFYTIISKHFPGWKPHGAVGQIEESVDDNSQRSFSVLYPLGKPYPSSSWFVACDKIYFGHTTRGI